MPNIPIATFIRTNHFGQQERDLANALSTGIGGPVTIICDESAGIVNTGLSLKVSLNDETPRMLNLGPLHHKWQWLWGDVCLYAARESVPNADWYVLVENDVFLTHRAAKVVQTLLSESDLKALACNLGSITSPPPFSKDLEQFGIAPDVGCIFAFVCVRGEVIDAMIELRREVQKSSQLRINDEAVLAATVRRYGYAAGDLYKLAPQLFSPEWFETNPPHLFEALLAKDDNERVVHPAVPFHVVLSRIRSGKKGYGRRRLRSVLEEAPIDMQLQIRQALSERK